MHATVIHVNIYDQAEAKRALDQEIIPMLKGAPDLLVRTLSPSMTPTASLSRFSRLRGRRRLPRHLRPDRERAGWSWKPSNSATSLARHRSETLASTTESMARLHATA